MSDHRIHIANAYALRRRDDGPLALVRVLIEGPEGAQVSKVLLGELAFLAQRALRTPVVPQGRTLLALPCATPWPSVLEHALGRFRLGDPQALSASLQDGGLRRPLLVLVAHLLRRGLVYDGSRALWHRQRGYFEHDLEPIGPRGFRCRGMELRPLFTEAGTLVLTLDPALCPLGPALGQMDADRRQHYLQKNPYASAAQGQTLRERNFVLQSKERKLRRVYLADALQLPGDPPDTVRVRMGKHGEGKPEPLAALYPVLAPREIDEVLGSNWRGQGSMPRDRQQRVETFLEKHLLPLAERGDPLFCRLRREGDALPQPAVRGGGPRPKKGQAVPLPEDASAISSLPWPTITVGRDGKSVPPEGNKVEYRMNALVRHGLRRVPSDWHTLEVVAPASARPLAEALAEACQSLLREWRCDQLVVRLCAVERAPGVEGVAALAEHYRAQERRPSLLLLCKGPQEPVSLDGDPAYRAMHQVLGETFALPIKVAVLRAKRDLRSAAINVLGSLLARGGACLWGLAPKSLTHDLCIGVDVGGRDRSGSQGNDHLLAVAMAGEQQPHFWVAQEAPAVTGETLSEELLWAVIKGAHGAIGEHSRRHWLYLRDGGIPDDEWKALQKVAARARQEGLLPGERAFTAVEVRKDHAMRLFNTSQGRWEQPQEGRLWSLPDYEAVLSVTGESHDLHGSADPLHLSARTILPTVEGKETRARALLDIWPLTHLNYSAPRLPSKLPIVLHAAQRLGTDLANGLSARHLPF